ncbi:MAG: transposase, partial [Patescibacteria group bacterium]
MINQLTPYLNLLFATVLPTVSIDLFKLYLLGLIQDDRYFSVLGISRKTRQQELWKIYTVLQQRINWQKIFYKLAKYFLCKKKLDSWYLIIDASPLEQPHAKYRITKRDKVSIEGMKNVPHDQLISLIITDGITTIVLDYRIWISPKVAKPYDYIKQTDLALDLLKKYQLRNIKVKTILIDSFFSSKQILKWLDRNGFAWFTRIKRSRILFIQGKKNKLENISLKYNQSCLCELKNIKYAVKISKILHQDEIYFIATNQTQLTTAKIKKMYFNRWKVEQFHREAKQQLGLDYIHMESYRALKNHIGFVCLAFSLLSALRKQSRVTIGMVKRTIQDELYST